MLRRVVVACLAAVLQTSAAAELLKTTVLAAEIPPFSTFPDTPMFNETSGQFDAFVVQFPFHAVVTVFFVLKEYDDGSLTIETQTCQATFGAVLGYPELSVIDSAEACYTEIPATRDVNKALDVNYDLGLSYGFNVTYSLYWDIPVEKHDTPVGEIFVVNTTGYSMNELYPAPNVYIREAYYPEYLHDYFLILTKTPEGQWFMTPEIFGNDAFWWIKLTQSDEPDWRNNPDAVPILDGEYIPEPTASWYVNGDGVNGGVGNPPLLVLDGDTLTQTFI